MNKLLGLIGLAAILASCGSSGVAPDGSASIRITNLKTEYKTGQGEYVACDNVKQLDGTYASQTAVATYFTLVGGIKDLTVQLKGSTTSAYDNNYVKTISASELAALNTNDYRLTFYADSSAPGESGFLPQGIVVKPIATKVKLVTVNQADRVGSFYTFVTVNTSTGRNVKADTSGIVIPRVGTYTTCNIQGDTTETL
ncbi:hypothetical protein [Deinococcus sonorensis]|uniref:Lipoprotein n=2 Tax=Deinococcus sonorensis TaxID=309891 RepID=A0AAU7UAX8_9DEIO